MNHSIVKAIRTYTSQQDKHNKWDTNLASVAYALNSALHSAINLTPYEAVFGEKPAAHGIDHRLRLHNDDEGDLPSPEKYDRIRNHIMGALEKAYDQRAQRYNLRARQIEFKPGDVVYKRNFRLSNAADKFMAKLDNKFEMVRIVSKVGSNCYILQDTNGKELTGTYNSQDLRG